LTLPLGKGAQSPPSGRGRLRRGVEHGPDEHRRLRQPGEAVTKALRIYDELGLVVPARVDLASGYRFYETGQLERARLMAVLRRIGVPLAGIKVIVESEPEAAALAVAEYWSEAEQDHARRRELAEYFVSCLRGKESVMYEVATRRIGERTVLCLKRNVDEQGAWALGKEFVGILTSRPLPHLEGVAGVAFCIYHAEVSADSDGPVEWCKPVPAERADELAAAYPELRSRTEPAHEEAYVHMGIGGSIELAQWSLVSEALRAWGLDNARRPSELGSRVTFLRTVAPREAAGPDCDFAVPLC
jgi:DNA-binding transcriptional MerR regulator